jgi:hypothetical protein
MGPLGALDLLLSAIVITLQMTVKDFDIDAYEPVPPGFISYAQLPEAARIVISAVPIVGSLLDLAGPLFQFGEQCPPGTHQESPGGLCFPDCPDGYKSDGAFICYKQYGEIENNGMLHTLTSITKKILVDIGTVPTSCGADEYFEAGICHKRCREGFSEVGALVCSSAVNIGAGEVVKPESCPAGYREDSLLTCSNTQPLTTTIDPCPYGTWDKAGSCWGFSGKTFKKARGGGTHCEGDPWKSVFESGHQVCWTDPIEWYDENEEVIKVWLHERKSTTTGGDIIGRLNNGGVCDDTKDRVDGLCYNKCPDGYYHAPGAPYKCLKHGEPETYTRDVGAMPSCGDKENISGLCYGSVPEGYTRKTLGLLDQTCPAGSADFGVGCTRESTTRLGTLKLVTELRKLLPE